MLLSEIVLLPKFNILRDEVDCFDNKSDDDGIGRDKNASSETQSTNAKFKVTN